MSGKKKIPHRRSESQSIRVVLDNNVIFSHRRLTGPSVDLLEMFVKRTGSTVVLPKIILEEACKKYHEDLAEKVSKVKTAIERLNGIVAHDSGAIPANLDIGEETKTYHASLLERVASFGGEIVEYEDLSLRLIAQRALAERRPFMSGDRGCRDTILWETVLHKIAGKKHRTVLITNDKAFWDQGQLHQHLMEDLTAAGFSEKAVVLFADLDEFLEAFAKPLPPVYMKGVLTRLMKCNYPGFSLAAFVVKHREDIIEASKPYGENVVRSTYWNPAVESLQDPVEITYSDFDEHEAEVTEAVELDKERVFLEVDIPCVVTLDGFLDKHDYYGLDDKANVSVLDSDWNDHVVWVQTDVKATTTLVLTFSITTGKVENWELSGIAPTEPNWQALVDDGETKDNTNVKEVE